MKKCECGCGRMPNKRRRFIHGHYSRTRDFVKHLETHIFKNSKNRIKKISDKLKHNKSAWKGGKRKLERDRIIKLAGRLRPDVCDICRTPAKDLKRKLCFDHDHRTGKFRGWICSSCNSALGFARDNIEILLAMIEYLQK